MAQSNKMGMSAKQLAASRRARFGNAEPKPLGSDWDAFYDRMQSGEMSVEEMKAEMEKLLNKGS